MYEKHFGFLESPFSVTPDPRFFYANPLYQEAFATLRYGIEARKGFIVIIGEAGTGKTTLLRRFMRTVGSTVHTSFIFNPRLSFIELLRLLLNDLGLENSSGDRFTLMAQLNDYLIEQLRRGHVVSLLIDEAQDLSDEMLEELRLLSNLETDSEKLIQIVLIGQPELAQKLQQSELRQLKQRVALRCWLLPIRSHEVAPYIETRLKRAGYEGKELFDFEAVEKISYYSAGIPRVINVLCDNVLLIAYAASKSKISAGMVEEAARDLQLLDLTQVKRDAVATDLKRPAAQALPAAGPKIADHTLVEGPWLSDFERVTTGMENKSSRWPYPRSLRLGMGLLLVVVLLAGSGIVLYSGPSGISLWALGRYIEDLVGMGQVNTEPMQARLMPQAAQEKAPQETSPLPLPVAPEPMLPTPDLDQGDAPVTETKQADQLQGLQSPPIAAEEDSASKSMTAGVPRAQGVESGPSARSIKEAQIEAQKTAKKESSLGTFVVVDASFLRDKPQSGAEITATLQPGTRIRLLSKTGDYLRVRSLGNEAIEGYVHREDAFFERRK